MIEEIEDIKISVIIPTYNKEKYLEECLNSVIRQKLKNIEIIIIDDASTDNSQAKINHFVFKDKRIKVLNNQKNEGAGVCRNKGIEMARGKYIAFLDADDYYPNSNVLQNLYNAATINNVKICGGTLQILSNGTLISSWSDNLSGFEFKKPELIQYKDYQFDYGFYRFIYERNLLLTNNICFTTYKRFQDPLFFVKAMVLAGEFFAIPDITYTYRSNWNELWDYRQAYDCLLGIRDNVELSKKMGYGYLHYLSFYRLTYDFLPKILPHITDNNEEFCSLLLDIFASVDYNLIKSVDNVNCFKIVCAINPLLAQMNRNNENSEEIKRIKTSISYKLGRSITYIPRKIRGLILIIVKRRRK